MSPATSILLVCTVVWASVWSLTCFLCWITEPVHRKHIILKVLLPMSLVNLVAIALLLSLILRY